MKLLLALILVIAIAAGGYFYLYPEEWRNLTEGTSLAPTPTRVFVYKWQNARGEWEITDYEPEAGVPYELLEYSSDTNIMPLAPKEKQGSE